MNIRTNTCGELKTDNINKSVTLNGWVNTVRLHGQVGFCRYKRSIWKNTNSI